MFAADATYQRRWLLDLVRRSLDVDRRRMPEYVKTCSLMLFENKEEERFGKLVSNLVDLLNRFR